MTSVVLVNPVPVLSRPTTGTTAARLLRSLSACTVGCPGAGSATSQPASALK
jgi:hypothetical protein